MSRQMLDLARGPVEVWQSGQGPTVLVAPGCDYGNSYRNTTWLAEELPGYQVVSVSRPGYGETPLSTATTFHEQAAMYVDILDAIGISECVVMGTSASGPIALLAARDYAPRTRGLVLCCAVARGLAAHKMKHEESNFDTDLLDKEQTTDRAMYARILADEHYASNTLPGLLGPAEMERYASDALVRANVRAYLENQLAGPPTVVAVQNDMFQLEALLREEMDSRVRVPTLVMHGDGDEIVPVAHARYHAELNPTVELDVIEGAGHGFMLTFRPRVVARLKAFLDRCWDEPLTSV